jgi:glycosyltransferase involved in cell wall biosynthesis
MARILYIHPGLVPPPPSPEHDKFHFLSQICSGDILLPVWWRHPDEVRRAFGAYPEVQRGTFSYHLILAARWPQPLRGLMTTAAFIRQADQLQRRKGPYDVVMCYGTNMTGLAAVLINRRIRGKLVAELPGVPEDTYLRDVPRPNRWRRLKHAVADASLHLVVSRSDRAKLLYPDQLAAYPRLHGRPSSVFHDFVPVSALNPKAPDGKYVLLLGHPWYLKGADLLIRAFRAVADEVPGYRLRIIGHIPDRGHLDDLARGCERVEILRAIQPAEAMAAISSCSLFVLPSRSEGMGRVLLEAMAAAKPIVATRVGGIPYYVRDGENGLLTEPDSVAELGLRIRDVLSQPSLASALGRRGRELATTEYSEESFVRHFGALLSAL